MSREFRFNLNEDSQANHTDASAKNDYASVGHVRNVCFKWLDGKSKFYNYAYLISGEFLPDANTINLIFTTDTVVLEGKNLLSLFENLMEHRPKFVECSNGRYAPISNGNEAFVLSISIQQN